MLGILVKGPLVDNIYHYYMYIPYRLYLLSLLFGTFGINFRYCMRQIFSAVCSSCNRASCTILPDMAPVFKNKLTATFVISVKGVSGWIDKSLESVLLDKGNWMYNSFDDKQILVIVTYIVNPVVIWISVMQDIHYKVLVKFRQSGFACAVMTINLSHG